METIFEPRNEVPSIAETEYRKWIDQDGLMGNKENPEKWSTGNALLETAFAYQSVEKYKTRTSFLLELIAAVANSTKTEFGRSYFLKNPGRYDEITHDDLIGVAYIHTVFADSIVDNLKYDLFYTNTGKLYWNAFSRANLRWFYRYRALRYLKLFDIICRVIDLYFVPSDASGLRLHFLKVERLNPDSYFYKRFKNKVIKLYGSMSNVHKDYYKTHNHPTVKYCKEL